MTSCPDDKASAAFFVPGCEELSTDFFDEFLTFNNENDAMLDYTSLPPSTYLDNSTSGVNSLDTSLSLTDDDTKPQIFDHSELDASPYLPTTQSQFYNGLMGRAAVSDTELLSLEDICLESPYIPQEAKYSQRSLPPSPSPTAAAASRKRARMHEMYSKPLRKPTSFDKALLRSPPIRKRTCSPTVGDAMKLAQESRAWERKLEEDALKFDFDFVEHPRVLTPPQTCQASDISLNLIRTPLKPSNLYANSASMNRSASSASYSTPLNTPALDHSHSRASSGQFPTSGPLFPVTPQNQNAAGSWGTLPSSAPVDPFSSSSMFTEIDEPLWWNHAATTKMAQPAPSVFHNPQQAAKNLTIAMQLHNGISYSTNENMSFDSASMTSGGLMIQMPTAHSYPVHMSTPPMQNQLHQNQQQQHCYRTDSTDSLRPRLHRRATHQQYAPASRRHYQHQRQARHTPPSPYNRPSTRKTRPRSTTSESGSSSSKSPSSTYNARKRRTPNSRSYKQSTPRTPTPGGGGAPPSASASALVDFVNFTPQDSKKILTGVAPSGSSKTKARREKEALDKRLKMSEAARRAVRAAGGDESLLQEEGLFACS